jgi:L-galactose dehydrogenase
MEYRELGRTGCKISTLGFGAATLGDVYGTCPADVGKRAVHYAIDSGINYFDVAPLYGLTLAEERLGDALKGRRDQVFLSSKCSRPGFNEFDFRGPQVEICVDQSLARLQTDHLDLLIVHDVEFGSKSQVLEETIPAALALREQGKVRFVAISGLPVQYLRTLSEAAELDAILSYAHYTLLNNQLDEVLAEHCQSHGIGLINASPLALGLLTEGGPQAWHKAPEQVKAIRQPLIEVCRKHGLDISEVALRYSLDYPNVACTLVGMSSEAEVAANLKVLDQQSDPALLAEIEATVAPVHNRMWVEGLAENNA